MKQYIRCKKCGRLRAVVDFDQTGPVTIQVDITPYPIVKGQETTITISGDLNGETLDVGSTAEVMVQGTILGFVPINEKRTFDICNYEGVSCPIKGQFTRTYTFPIPANIPRVNVDVTIVIKNSSGKVLVTASKKQISV